MNPLSTATKPIVIMGGAPRLIRDMRQVPEDAIRVSANWHALAHFSADYMVFIDGIVGGKSVQSFIFNFGVPTISFRGYANHVTEFPYPRPVNTGIYAAWLAAQSGQTVYLAGFDFYSSGKYVSGNKAPDKNIKQEYFIRCIASLKRLTDGADLIALNPKIKQALKSPFRGFLC